MLEFLLNGAPQRIDHLDPNTSVLDYLRDHRGQTGTKEGCASGDCGACTVVLARPEAGDLQYRSINACITPIGTLQGQALFTVEGLADRDALHPAQRAMVDCHGSQCGFCTPGFVMSLFAHRLNHDAADRDELLESLGGNLCRCTGYRPILDAGVQMYEPQSGDAADPDTAQLLTSLANVDSGPVTLVGDGRRFSAPTSLTELADILAVDPDARLLAGGTDLCLEMTQQLATIDHLVFTGRVPELCEISVDNDLLRIGAAATYTACRKVLVADWPDLAELLDRLGSLQIRNQGTVGGNVANASPIGDMPPVLLALDAQLVLRRGAESRQLPIAEFFQGYRRTALAAGEFIERIEIPRSTGDAVFQVHKISKRLEDDISAVCGALYLRRDGARVSEARIAFGGMAEIPSRAPRCETALQGRALNEASIADAMAALDKDFAPISDFRASADYRRTVARNLLRRLLFSQAGNARTDQLRVTQYA